MLCHSIYNALVLATIVQLLLNTYHVDGSILRRRQQIIQVEDSSVPSAYNIGILTAETNHPESSSIGGIEDDGNQLLHLSRDYFDLFQQNKKDWAQFQSYDYVHTKINSSARHKPSDLRLDLIKIDLMLEYLPQYDWIVWLDMDTIIVDMTIQVEEYIKHAQLHKPGVNLIIDGQETISQVTYKSSVILLRNSFWSKRFLIQIQRQLQDFLQQQQYSKSIDGLRGVLLDNIFVDVLAADPYSESHVHHFHLQDYWSQKLVYLPRIGILHFSGCTVEDERCLDMLDRALNHMIDYENMYVYIAAPYVQHIYNIFAGIYVLFALDRLIHILGRYFGPNRLQKMGKARLPETMDPNDKRYPMVAVQLPMFNESSCAVTIIDSAAQIEWPMQRIFIQIVDDSTSQETRDIIDERVMYWVRHGVNIEVRRRPHRNGFKAGAMNEAMNYFPPDTRFIAIFDADFLPQPKFFLKTIPYMMANNNAAFVQTCWIYTNPKESLLTRMQEISLNFHFFCEQEMRFRTKKFFNFNGTAGVWRLKALVGSGGWHTDTLVEDMDLSLRAYADGWDFIFLKDVKCLNEIPPTFQAYRGQQHRWTSGPMQVLKKAFKTVYLSRKLSMVDKIFCLWFFLRNYVHIINFLYFLILIPMMIWIPRVTLYEWAVIYLPAAISMSNVFFTPNEAGRILSYVLFENAMCLYKTGALICGVLNIGKAKQWIVTPKYARKKLVSAEQEQLDPEDAYQIVKNPSHKDAMIIQIEDQLDSFATERRTISSSTSMASLPSLDRDSPDLESQSLESFGGGDISLGSAQNHVTFANSQKKNDIQQYLIPRPADQKITKLISVFTAYGTNLMQRPEFKLHRNEMIMFLYLLTCGYYGCLMRQYGIGVFCLLNAVAYLILATNMIGRSG
ncbi:hypothetical protein MP228_006247 [Amoeboaphelidium protococcarum]|nr:hypothetical protein MP228_006247 [Amoeboaphelidium protococcarum]